MSFDIKFDIKRLKLLKNENTFFFLKAFLLLNSMYKTLWKYNRKYGILNRKYADINKNKTKNKFLKVKMMFIFFYSLKLNNYLIIILNSYRISIMTTTITTEISRRSKGPN